MAGVAILNETDIMPSGNILKFVKVVVAGVMVFLKKYVNRMPVKRHIIEQEFPSRAQR